MNSFISSYWGMYAVQVVLHSAIASVLIDCAFIAWDIRAPHVKQRFRLMAIFLPVVSFPVYQLLSPGRGDIYFRLGGLLDSNKWLLFELWGGIPLFKVLIVIPALTSIIFVLQELLPIGVEILEQLRGGSEEPDDDTDTVEEKAAAEALEEKVAEALESLPLHEDRVMILHDEDLVLFSNTGHDPRIYVSTGLIKSFNREQLQAAFAHEIGHIRRSRKPVLIIAYIFRVLMFYNPVAMVEFRKLAHGEENVCDDIAVALTGNPGALCEAVDMLRPDTGYGGESPASKGVAKGMGDLAAAFGQHSLDVILKSRIQRIRRGLQDESSGPSWPGWPVPYFVTLALIIGINYFVV